MDEPITRTILSAEDFQAFKDACDAPSAPTPALVEAMKRYQARVTRQEDDGFEDWALGAFERLAVEHQDFERLEELRARIDLRASNAAMAKAVAAAGVKGPHPRVVAIRAAGEAARLKAVRILHPTFNTMTPEQQEAATKALLHTTWAMEKAGFTLTYPRNGDDEDTQA